MINKTAHNMGLAKWGFSTKFELSYILHLTFAKPKNVIANFRTNDNDRTNRNI